MARKATGKAEDKGRFYRVNSAPLGAYVRRETSAEFIPDRAADLNCAILPQSPDTAPEKDARRLRSQPAPGVFVRLLDDGQ